MPAKPKGVRRALAAKSGTTQTPHSPEVVMSNVETHLAKQETLEECNIPLEIATITTLLGQQQESIKENSELITTTSAEIFELEPVVDKIEEEF
ncbi:uncharacterized protein BKA55DRAFT_689641 [Fusarium redolens]|uniref:Uncharacterized protein n=1 Tax=Fusarium redolens TaxID=48865 RepID=A0A9P9HC16_FUSRE|nr:uncharacterized protein BKA55DRAFT_689641 [Fusarium redolens]KAH7254138.1 hypothetical protein BKA55DRAFT_689641 [Fusarium redolens]